jgi:hypothetical protein
MRKCLLLENYWALKSTEDTTSSIPNDGSAVCFGYLLAFRGLQGAVRARPGSPARRRTGCAEQQQRSVGARRTLVCMVAEALTRH